MPVQTASGECRKPEESEDSKYCTVVAVVDSVRTLYSRLQVETLESGVWTVVFFSLMNRLDQNISFGPK